MKINKIEIAAFGKFKNYTLDFSDGFNLIFGKNEDGKSTVMAFISLMLYGTAGTSSRLDISGNIRKKYAPWSGEKMAGDMEIECGGRSYLIHKEFRATAKTDKVTVTDTETGNAVNLPPDTEIGKYFLGIDYSAFEKSIFGGSADSFAGTESSDISTRLSNLTEGGDEAVSPKLVASRIEAAKDDLVKKRSKGKIALAQDKIDELSGKVEKITLDQNRRSALSEEYSKIEEELSSLSEKAKQGRLALENEEKRRKASAYRDLARLYSDAKEADDRLSAQLKGDNPKDILSVGEALKNAVLFAKDKLSKTERLEIENSVSEEDMKLYFTLTEERRSVLTESLASSQKEAEKKRHTRLTLSVLALIGAVFILLGVIGGILEKLLFIGIPVGIALALPYFIYKITSKPQTESAALSPEISEIDGKITSLFASHGCHSAEEFERAYRNGIAAAEMEKLYAKAEEEYFAAKDKFIHFANKYETTDTLDGASAFLNKAAEMAVGSEKAWQNAAAYASSYEITEKEADKLLNLAQDIEATLPKLTNIPVNNEEIESEIRMKNQQLLEIKGMLGAEPEDLGAVLRELAENEERLNEMQVYYDSLCLAGEVLAEAEDEMRRSFAPALKDRASVILSRLTGGKYKSLSTDKAYEIEVKSEDTAGYRKWHYLSRGTCAQSYLALRIAVCEMLSDNEPVPLLLDDVLADYDDERAALAFEFLESYAENGRQILFFTCHSRTGKIKETHNMLG